MAENVSVYTQIVEIKHASTVGRPVSVERSLFEGRDGGKIEVVWAKFVSTFLQVFLDDGQANLKHLIPLCCRLYIVVELLEGEFAAAASSASDARELEIERDKVRFCDLLGDLDCLMRELIGRNVHDA